ncbi:glycine cleavage system protein H [Kitasatospora purpeofusca]|uniref:glycine cleavage system protein H n=1 Tax=Kitasatospora purpeofusca TaxID=67352 RepID=UPI002A5A7A62|nr:glycine cleavage system protein H [Kitasatospora purpeofusca]MDY0814390.1 glycine cleavage system protein H [Kitasatospora purpeofusca]
MANVPADRRYARTGEWARWEADGSVAVGFSAPLAKEDSRDDMLVLGLPEVGRTISAGEEVESWESVLRAGYYYNPVGGQVTAVNEQVSDDPGDVSFDPYGTWIFKLKPSSRTDFDDLYDAAAYTASIAE